jgi:hypothetical protein
MRGPSRYRSHASGVWSIYMVNMDVSGCFLPTLCTPTTDPTYRFTPPETRSSLDGGRLHVLCWLTQLTRLG